MKSRLVATEVAYCSRDDCFAGALPKALRLEVSLATSRGRRLAYFDVVAAFEPAPVDQLVILLWPRGLGQGHTAVLHKALYGTRKASRLWQGFLREVLDDAVWKASVIFASMYTLGGKRGVLGRWIDDLLVKAEEKDLDAVELERLDLKVLTRIGERSSADAGFLKRVLRYDAATESFLWCSGRRYVQDAAATRSARRQTHLARRALVRHCETETKSSTRTKQPPSRAHSGSDVCGSGQE